MVMLRLDMGSRIPMGTTAMGRAYLVASSPKIRDEPLQRLRAPDPLLGHRPSLPVSKAMLDHSGTRCTYSFGEWKREINGIATPLRLTPELPLIIINAAAPSQLTTPEHFLTVVRPGLLDAAARIAKSYQKIKGSAAPIA